jgi:hypothetical protein
LSENLYINETNKVDIQYFSLNLTELWKKKQIPIRIKAKVCQPFPASIASLPNTCFSPTAPASWIVSANLNGYEEE